MPGATVRGDPGVDIRGLAYHTRDVADGTLFFCVPGLRYDGHEFADKAVEAGATALVCERDTVFRRHRSRCPVGAPRHGAHGRALVRRADAEAERGRRHRHQRQDDHCASGGGPVRRRRPPIGSSGHRGRPHRRREHRVTLTTAESLDLQRMFAEMVRRGTRRARSRSARTPSLRTAPWASTSTPSSSATSRATISTTTRTSRTTSAPSVACSCRTSGGRESAVAVVNIGDEFGARLAAECAPLYGDSLWTCAVDEGGASRRGRRRPRPRAPRRRLELHARLRPARAG